MSPLRDIEGTGTKFGTCNSDNQLQMLIALLAPYFLALSLVNLMLGQFFAEAQLVKGLSFLPELSSEARTGLVFEPGSHPTGGIAL